MFVFLCIFLNRQELCNIPINLEMPLPAVLQAQVAKSGILNNESEPTENSEQNEPNTGNNKEDEEVIAEDYDEKEGQIPKSLSVELDLQRERKEQIAYAIKGYPACPNKYNIWHECSTFCKDNWTQRKKDPTKRYCQIRKKMLALYPLPENWTEVYDPGTARHYYWNEENDRVSWLPPNHPRAVISVSAAKLRYNRVFGIPNAREIDKDSDSESSWSSDRGESSSSDKDTEDDDEYAPKRKRKLNSYPMDLSSNSYISRYYWSNLSKRLQAITGAGTTASGPLYQTSPCPNTGAVLGAKASKSP